MIKNFCQPISFLLFAAQIMVSACGTRDYETPAPRETVRPPVTQQFPGADPQFEKRVIGASEDHESGYLWRLLNWTGVADQELPTFKSQLADTAQSGSFDAFGTTVIGGAVMGVIVRASRSWFFGQPIQSDIGHWFWRGVYRTANGTAQGASRGALFSFTCYLLLVGADPLPYEGLLGDDFKALSSALVLGGMSSIVGATMADSIVRGDWASTDTRWGRFINRSSRARHFFSNLQEWTTTTSIGRGLRYKVAPGIIILGIGTGVGLVVYDSLHVSEEETYRPENFNPSGL